jgi:sugar phosphate permease
MVCTGGNGSSSLRVSILTSVLFESQKLTVISGVVTIGIALICIFILPDTPLTTRWLTPEQRQLAHDRIERDTVGRSESKGARAGFMQALRDPRLYLLVFMQNMHLSATSFNQVRTIFCPSQHPVLTVCSSSQPS